ncbi:MAG: DUF1294 domain-containing protein [Oscillospiraceae bacterium]|nr:DUF1294 domain-containing protein [Oscillospiraceae bacterium]
MLKYYLIILGVLSAFTFLIYGMDKNAAKKNLWRTPERRLLLFGFCGGAVGGLLGMQIFHHKTRKWYFWTANLLGIAWQSALAVYLFITRTSA